jgi:serine/threonine protein kinase
MEARNDDDLNGTRVSHYMIGDLIGAGGMGKVYRARDERLGRDVAIKVINPSIASQPEWRDAPMLEARLLSRLNHPHVAGIYELINESGQDFLVMELVPGATLRQLLDGGPLPASEVVSLGRQMTDGLAAVHAARVIHGDIKPANLKVTPAGDLKILDFGLAKALSSPAPSVDFSTTTLSEIGLAGTVPFMAPEQLRGERTDERSDIFSAGAVLYEMASGCAAFPQRQVACLIDAILHEDPIALRSMNPSVPKGLAQIVTKALRKRPCDRQQSADQLTEELDGLTSVRDVRAVASARTGLCMAAS